MNNLLKYSQLAKTLGVSNASISMAIQNGKLIPNEKEKRIDIEMSFNKLWIESQMRSGKSFDLNRIFTKEIVKKEEDKEESLKSSYIKETTDTTNFDELRNVEFKQKVATLKKTVKSIKLDDLKIKKLEGALIPFDAVEMVFIYSSELFRNTYLQEIDGLANIYIERLGGTHNQFIELKKELTDKVNEIHALVKENLLNGLDGIVDEYKEIRSRGERS